MRLGLDTPPSALPVLIHGLADPRSGFLITLAEGCQQDGWCAAILWGREECPRLTQECVLNVFMHLSKRAAVWCFGMKVIDLFSPYYPPWTVDSDLSFSGVCFIYMCSIHTHSIQYCVQQKMYTVILGVELVSIRYQSLPLSNVGVGWVYILCTSFFILPTSLCIPATADRRLSLDPLFI